METNHIKKPSGISYCSMNLEQNQRQCWMKQTGEKKYKNEFKHFVEKMAEITETDAGQRKSSRDCIEFKFLEYSYKKEKTLIL